MRHSFPSEQPLEFLWCRDRCKRRFDLETRDKYWLKDLTMLRRRGFNLDLVLFVDDTPHCLERNYGNHVGIAAYGGEPDDQELARI